MSTKRLAKRRNRKRLSSSQRAQQKVGLGSVDNRNCGSCLWYAQSTCMIIVDELIRVLPSSVYSERVMYNALNWRPMRPIDGLNCPCWKTNTK